jgi:hypothetical protein
MADDDLRKRLRASGAVLIEGPKACGKTATARRVAASEVLFDVDDQARAAVEVDPSIVLAGATPRLLDEWQLAPRLWNHVRRAIDDRGVPGQFILTGSAVPADEITRHTGAGRISRLHMRPMSLFESGHSTGNVSLQELLEGTRVGAADPELGATTLAERICAGGWPGLLHLPPTDAARGVRDYLAEVQRTDIRRVDRTDRDPVIVGRVLRSLARHVATEAAATTIARDAAGESPHPETVRDHLSALERLFLIEDQPAWAPHLRSRSILRTSPKRHFVDPSLATAALRAGPEHLLRDFELFGLLFESLSVRDLRIYADPLDGRILHYRDNTGLEVDAIVECADGRWGAVEIKLASARVDDAAATLHRFLDRVDTTRTGEPSFLAVLVGGGYAYTRDDGVAVVPLGALGP